MKFAKELEQDLVPEWRVKYLNYKAGKKHVKAVARAVSRAHGTPALGKRGDLQPRPPFTPYDESRRGSFMSLPQSENALERSPLRTSPAPLGRNRVGASSLRVSKSASRPIPTRDERSTLADPSTLQYGSFINTPPDHSPAPTPSEGSRHSNAFELPAPAIKVPSRTTEPPAKRPTFKSLRSSVGRMALRRSLSMNPNDPPGQHQPPPDLTLSPGGTPLTPRQRLVRIFTTPSQIGRRTSRVSIGMQDFDEVRERERELFAFLDSELDKVETFYHQKEEQAGKRLTELREQLHEMRNRRIEELAEARRRKEQQGASRTHSSDASDNGNGNGKGVGHSLDPMGWIDPIKDKLFKPGPNTRALAGMVRTPAMGAQNSKHENRDYSRRPVDHDVPYRTAKRKLKLALQEFYRGLELLKSYALLNRTAFRKINKKYDKAVNARPAYRYMNEKVSKAWFVNSDVLDGHLTTVEDLYARYFEKGNHKIAAGKLRGFAKRSDQSPSAFRSGLLVGIGAVFTVQGLAYGADLLLHAPDPVMRVHTAYLLQIYGGYFLMLYLFALFCLDCRTWTASKISYPFIFELDLRDHLDWREVAEFPSFFLLLFGLFIWLNFSQYGASEMYLYYPVILVGVTVAVIFFPAPIFRYKARRWFLYAHWRLFFAGLYPVEFRDFFLGDIYCSLTYAMSNIELFFCLYATYWGDPEQCNSNHSRLLGFFSTLPAVWRALQCIRRYYDTRNVFPHLVNCGKYAMTILAAVFLSIYRIDGTHTNLALFITFSTINGIYTSIWDLFMDFSLLQPHSRNPFLRDVLALRSKWMYYGVMALDPILRFSWIFYAIFTHNTQHSTIVSFLVALAEVTRRGIWTLFRVENEHCANVSQYRASRDVPLPYHLEPIIQQPSLSSDVVSQTDAGEIDPEQAHAGVEQLATDKAPATGHSTGTDAGRRPSASVVKTPGTPGAAGGTPDDAGTVRRRRADTLGRFSITKIMAEAHKQDFEKKRKPTELDKAKEEEEEEEDENGGMQSEQDDDDETGSMLEERMRVREAEGFVRRGRNGVDESD